MIQVQEPPTSVQLVCSQHNTIVDRDKLYQVSTRRTGCSISPRADAGSRFTATTETSLRLRIHLLACVSRFVCVSVCVSE
jgi:hypothetical protein